MFVGAEADIVADNGCKPWTRMSDGDVKGEVWIGSRDGGRVRLDV